MSINFSDDKIVITGGGVGRVLVQLFRQLGASVLACDRDLDLLTAVESQEKLSFDQSNPAQIRQAAKAICIGGAPTIVIANAGWTCAETIQDLNHDSIAKELAVNLQGVIEFTQALLPAMRKNKRGSFVFVSSINALSHFGNPVYSAAKAGTLAWMKAIATEEGHLGIRANAVAPGSIRTSQWDHRLQANPNIIDQASQLYPLNRMVSPEEVAKAVAFLASDWASGITGVTVPVDAGMTGGNLPFLELIR